MDTTSVIVVPLGLLFFIGGGAWLEVHSRKKKRAERQGERSSQPRTETADAGRAADGRAAEIE